jgi:DNA-directed RNA polymerase specialized sigma24 family protein
LAYNATGSLAQSEDLAQEAFVIAWKQLPALREPEKLRSWLCGIVRNLGRRAREARSSSPCSGRNRWRPQPPRWPRRNLALSIRPSAGRRRQSSGARWRPSPRPTANP